LNEKVKQELERIEDMYGNILQNIHEVSEEALGNQEKNEQQAITD